MAEMIEKERGIVLREPVADKGGAYYALTYLLVAVLASLFLTGVIVSMSMLESLGSEMVPPSAEGVLYVFLAVLAAVYLALARMRICLEAEFGSEGEIRAVYATFRGLQEVRLRPHEVEGISIKIEDERVAMVVQTPKKEYVFMPGGKEVLEAFVRVRERYGEVRPNERVNASVAEAKDGVEIAVKKPINTKLLVGISALISGFSGLLALLLGLDWAKAVALALELFAILAGGGYVVLHSLRSGRVRVRIGGDSMSVVAEFYGRRAEVTVRRGEEVEVVEAVNGVVLVASGGIRALEIPYPVNRAVGHALAEFVRGGGRERIVAQLKQWLSL